MRIFQEEVFGPFTSVTPFTDEADALRLANDSPFGLAAAIRTCAMSAAPISVSGRPGQKRHRLDQRPSPARPGIAVGAASAIPASAVKVRHGKFLTIISTPKSVMVATHDAPFDWYRDTANQRRLNMIN